MNLDLTTEHLEEIVEDVFHTRPCEGQHHQRGLSGHAVEEFAAFIVSSPCCGPKLLQCAARVAQMFRTGELYCSVCKKAHPTATYTFTPL